MRCCYFHISSRLCVLNPRISCILLIRVAFRFRLHTVYCCLHSCRQSCRSPADIIGINSSRCRNFRFCNVLIFLMLLQLCLTRCHLLRNLFFGFCHDLFSHDISFDIIHVYDNIIFCLRFRLAHLFLTRFFLQTLLIDLLLLRRQRRIFLFQFQCLLHIFSTVEPQDKIITRSQAFLHLSGLTVELCQFIGPALGVLLPKVLLQNLNLVFDRASSSAIDLIFQNILVVIMRCHLHIIRIIFHCLIILMQRRRHLYQSV